MMLGMIGLTHHAVSEEYWAVKKLLRTAKKDFAKQYTKLFPHDPIEKGEITVVAQAVIELSDANLEAKFKK